MDLDIRYVAGLFDGEGWITVCVADMSKWKRTNYTRYQLHVGIGMVHKPIIDAMHRQFGGNVFVKRPTAKQGPKTRIGFIWRLSSGPAAAFLSQVLPYLVVKREEAQLAIEFQEHIRTRMADFKYRRHLFPELDAYRKGVVAQLRALKRREYLPPIDSDPIPGIAA